MSYSTRKPNGKLSKDEKNGKKGNACAAQIAMNSTASWNRYDL